MITHVDDLYKIAKYESSYGYSTSEEYSSQIADEQLIEQELYTKILNSIKSIISALETSMSPWKQMRQAVSSKIASGLGYNVGVTQYIVVLKMRNFLKIKIQPQNLSCSLKC